MTAIKMCGITDAQTLQLLIELQVDYAGLVFYPPSPRAITIKDAETLVSGTDHTSIKLVGLFCDPDDQTLENALKNLPLSLIQLHGQESPERVSTIKERYGHPVMKALPIETENDLTIITDYQDRVDWLLLDSKTTKLGGSGQTFDWQLLDNITLSCPWMLAGGLNSENIHEALSQTSPDVIDVSSGIEETKGVKSHSKIKEFVEILGKTR